MDERERKEGKTELQKFEYLENKNCVKKKKRKRKIADTSVKITEEI